MRLQMILTFLVLIRYSNSQSFASERKTDGNNRVEFNTVRNYVGVGILSTAKLERNCVVMLVLYNCLDSLLMTRNKSLPILRITSYKENIAKKSRVFTRDNYETELDAIGSKISFRKIRVDLKHNIVKTQYLHFNFSLPFDSLHVQCSSLVGLPRFQLNLNESFCNSSTPPNDFLAYESKMLYSYVSSLKSIDFLDNQQNIKTRYLLTEFFTELDELFPSIYLQFQYPNNTLLAVNSQPGEMQMKLYVFLTLKSAKNEKQFEAAVNFISEMANEREIYSFQYRNQKKAHVSLPLYHGLSVFARVDRKMHIFFFLNFQTAWDPQTNVSCVILVKKFDKPKEYPALFFAGDNGEIIIRTIINELYVFSANIIVNGTIKITGAFPVFYGFESSMRLNQTIIEGKLQSVISPPLSFIQNADDSKLVRFNCPKNANVTLLVNRNQTQYSILESFTQDSKTTISVPGLTCDSDCAKIVNVMCNSYYSEKNTQ